MTSAHVKQRGFTLIEILVVIVILSILGGLAAQTLLSRPDAARVQAAQTDLRTLSYAGCLSPRQLSLPLVRSGFGSLSSTPERLTGSKNWNPGGYLKNSQQTLGALPTCTKIGTVVSG